MSLARAIAEANRKRKIAPAAKNLRILVFDIENAPNAVWTWGLWKQNISINQIDEPGRVLGFAWKWVGEKEAHWTGEDTDGHEGMVRKCHELLSEADVVVHFNGVGFDVPHVNREFLLLGLAPAKPFKQVDLLRVARKQFRFPSNKLDYIAQQLGIGHKVHHEGFDLWLKYMDGDAKAQAKMGRYAKQDVKLTEKLFHILLPWLTNVPHIGQLAGESEHSCWACGSEKLVRNGEATAFVTSYPLFACKNCGAWVRSTKKLQHTTTTRRAA
jgi:DNA polymerase elongation subunit (family B)